MKRYFGIIIAIVGVAASIVWTMRKFDKQTADSAREKNELRIKAEFLERVAWVRNVPEPKPYGDEVGNLMTWYFKEITEHLNKHGGNRDFNDYLKELEDRGSKGGKEDGKVEEKKAVYEYTKKVFDQFKSRNYAPYWTATDKGIRFDVLTADTVRVGTEDKIHMPLVVWGLPREERTDDRGIKRVSCNASFRFNWKLFDEKGKLIAEIPGEGGPDSRVDWPDRFVKFFPPMVILGHYDLDKLPPEAKTAEISFTITSRANTGGEINASYLWKLDVPAAWKLAAGESWKGAQESIRPEDEIDPSKKKK